jgi:hypothetical protein
LQSVVVRCRGCRRGGLISLVLQPGHDTATLRPTRRCVIDSNITGFEKRHDLCPTQAETRAVLLAFLRNRPDAWCKPRYFVICVEGQR